MITPKVLFVMLKWIILEATLKNSRFSSIPHFQNQKLLKLS